MKGVFEMNFNVLIFPNMAIISYIILLCALIMFLIVVVSATKKRNDVILLLICAFLFITGLTCLSRVRYDIRDCIEQSGYTLVIAIPHFSTTEYKEVDYHDYWRSMGYYTYQLDSKTNTIYMRRSRFY